MKKTLHLYAVFYKRNDAPWISYLLAKEHNLLSTAFFKASDGRTLRIKFSKGQQSPNSETWVMRRWCP